LVVVNFFLFEKAIIYRGHLSEKNALVEEVGRASKNKCALRGKRRDWVG
jgi:hypothetical protein